MELLEGRVAIVTGAAQGIGLAIARRLAEEGAAVVVADLDQERARDAALDLPGQGMALGVGCDVTDPDQVEALVSRASGELGELDILVNNAGITRDATMRKMPVEDFDAVIGVHLRGTWLGTKAASLAMREHGRGGSIVNVSSISGKVGNAGQTNYSAAKAGIVGMTKAAAKELGHAGIRVNAIQPGLIHTAMTEKMPAEIFAARVKEIPLGRAGEPEDVADAALFLASDLSSYLTGIVIEVAGGRHI
ncbi:MAG: 3-oxoacyl-ACP reductase FabG [Solirubrobacterales bacterium]